MTTPAERLHLLYEVNRRLAGFTDLDELLRYATRRTRELFDAEGCAVLLVDRARQEFYFPIASQSESSRASAAVLSEIRFPADRGIAGWVIVNNQSALVTDTAQDSRFYAGVDALSHTTTRSVLCSPLRTPSGIIGVLEVINPNRDSLTADDLEFLEALATDVALAHEKASLYQHLQGEVISLRQACGWAGFSLLAVGIFVSVGTTLGHLAMALPVSELPTRAGLLAGLAATVFGILLIGVARGWFVRDMRPPR